MNVLHKFLAHKAYNMRVNSLKMTTQAGSGHPTSALSAAELISVLFFNEMKFDLNDPHNPHNDRFILSKGHASPIFYAVYKELGILSEKDLMTYRDFRSMLEGHPTSRFAWTEAATGSLGQGLSVGAGMALNARMRHRDYYTYVLMGDSEVSEGSNWEAAELSAYYKLNNLIGIIDVNRLGQRGDTMFGYDLKSYADKFAAFGWQPIIVDGHEIQSIIDGFTKAKSVADKPSIILAKTVKGFGVDQAEGKNGFHGKAFSQDELPKVLKHMAQRFAKFVDQPDFEWKPKPVQSEARVSSGPVTLSESTFDSKEPLATRKAFGLALRQLGKQSEAIVSLDAEVSNSTFSSYFAEAFPQRFIECFIAEQNMVGMAVGLEKRGNIPFVSTFGAFFSRAFDQIRMAAVGKAALRLVGSHAGVSIGQDGPSQMALEDIALMRTLPDSIVFYPCDAVSTWQLVGLMANISSSISYLRTTRSAMPNIYDKNEEFKVGGFKILKQNEKDQLCIIAAGITVFEALKAYEQLSKEGISVAVIDLYCIKPIDADELQQCIKKACNKVITVEDHYQAGGIGEAVLSVLAPLKPTITNLYVDKLPRSGKPEELRAYEGIDAKALIDAVKKLVI